MTGKQERKLRRESEWVRERFGCSTEKAFEHLVEVIEKDIQTFNDLSDGKECTIEKVKGGEYTFTFGNRVAALRLSRECFVAIPAASAFYSRQKSVLITPKWDADEMRCDLIVDGKKESFHRVSQMVIGELLFDS